MAYVSVGAPARAPAAEEKKSTEAPRTGGPSTGRKQALKDKQASERKQRDLDEANKAKDEARIGMFMTVFKGLLVAGGSYAGWRWWKKRKRSAA